MAHVNGSSATQDIYRGKPLNGVSHFGCMVFLVHLTFVLSTHNVNQFYIGCGKTVLANYLEERLSVTNNASQNHFAHFFKKSSHEASAHPKNLASSFIAKILRGYMLDKSALPILSVDILIGLADRYASSMECHFQSLWDAFLPLIGKYHSFVMIVDGLDECPETSDQEALLRGLHGLSSMPNSKIIVLSRFSLRFQNALGAPVEIVMDANTVREDIRTMVMAEVRRTPKLDPIKEQLLDKASRLSNGMFLWARLMLDSVKSASSLNSQNTNLDCFPPGLYAVYDRHLLTQSVGLDSVSSRRRRKIFMLLLGSLQPFTVNEVSYILALTAHTQEVSAGDLLLDPHAEILRLCYPFASVEDGRLQLIHASVKEYFLKLHGSKDYMTEKDVAPLRFSDSQINEYLANKCLFQLSLAQYSSFDLMSTLAAENLETSSVDTSSQIGHIIGGFYEYACLHWHTHLTSVSTPTQSTLARLKKFLSSSHVVTWSEILFLLKGGIDDGPVIEVRSCLKSWLTLQHFEFRETIPVDDFIPASYKRVISTMNKTLDHKAKALVIGSRLAEYYLWLGDTESAHEMFQTVARGFEAKIGNTSRLLLSQRTKMATCLTVAGRLQEAVEKLLTVTKLQKQILGACHKDVFISMSNLGFSEYFLANFANAQNYLQQASDGLLATTGRTAKEYLYNQLYLGLALERQRQIATSHSLYLQTWRVWMQLSGPDNPATLMTQSALASSYRKLGQYEEAEKHYTAVLAARQRSCGLDHFITFDVAIGLAHVYFEMEKFEKAMAIVELITPLDILRLPAHAERNCQVTHLRGLLASRLTCEETSLAILEDLFVSPHWCRELLWARVSLANLLKAQGKSENWPSYYDGLICPLQSGKSLPLQEERCLAEAAVQLVRAANHVEANELLASESYQWIRISDFYILPGGPITDTA
jgi:tetratricopeptide (TPR) repeat protein